VKDPGTGEPEKMSEQPAAPQEIVVPQDAETAVPGTASSVAEPRPTETIEFWKQQSRTQEARAKANAEAAKRLTEIADRQANLEQERDAARSDALRFRAAATHKVSAEYLDLLGSGTPEEIEAKAQKLGALSAQATELVVLREEIESLKTGKQTPPKGRPVENLRPGAAPTGTQSEEDLLWAQMGFPQGQ
jgi:hypothetical protein